ncbi:MAG TPA: Glu-tRNA(Gln) amidotransferase subunit GatD [Candidatus Nanoarchaeia archaeon]|nr:Glu-tRNA(Gln) amidotransferase subunit GatD [Candidatus Nanoarchaeia archaeon]
MKKEFSEAQQVEIHTKDKQVFKGILLPSQDSSIVMLKLASGYNIGLDKKDIQQITKLGKLKIERPLLKEHKHNPKLPTISILHTGGTVASQIDYTTGAVSARFTPEELLAKFPELQQYANIHSRLVSNMFSEDMRFSHYNLLAKEIEREAKKGIQGIIITHGTDTLHYTAAALTFMLHHLPIPVILVGAQRSSDRGSSDAFLNLVSAVFFASQTDFSGVAICMHKDLNDELCIILPGLNVRKNHTSRRDAFACINTSPIAEINYNKQQVQFLKRDHKKRDPDANFHIRLMNEKLEIGMLYAHPHMHADEVARFNAYDGLIIIGTGMGHLSINHIDKFTAENEKIFRELAKLARKMPVIMTPQPLWGRINLNVYSTGRKLQEIGVQGNFSDMTPETAFLKLAYLLSTRKSKEEINRLINTDMFGEISKRSMP